MTNLAAMGSLFTTDTCTYQIREFSVQQDMENLQRICANVHGGADYLPKTAPLLSKDPNSSFLVLAKAPRDNEDPSISNVGIVAVGNLRKFKPGMSWLEAIRTCEHTRGKGLATKLVIELMDIARKQHGHETFACTVESNFAMKRVFEKVGMQKLGQINLCSFAELKKLPGWTASSAGVGASDDDEALNHMPKPLLQALNVEHLVSNDCRDADAIEVKQVEAEAEVNAILEKTKNEGGAIGCIVGLYEIVSDDVVRESIRNGQVWILHRKRGPDMERCLDFALVVLFKDERISSLKSPWVLSVSASSAKALEMALWFACTDGIASIRKLGDENVAFTVAFDVGEIAPHRQSAPVIEALPLVDDRCLLFGSSLEL